MPNRHTVAREPRCAVRQEALILLLADREAEIRPVIAAVLALTALGREERDDVIAGLDILYVLADALHHSRALVAEHGGGVAGGIGARGRVEIRVAHAAGDQSNEYLAGLGFRELDLLHLEQCAELLEDGCADLHRMILADRSRAVARAHGHGCWGHVWLSDTRTWL